MNAPKKKPSKKSVAVVQPNPFADHIWGVWNQGGPVAAYARFSPVLNGWQIYNARTGRSLALAAYNSMPELLAAEPFKVNPEEGVSVVREDKSK